MPGYRAKPERALLLRLAAFDWNCPQHIKPRFSEAELADALAPLRQRLQQLEIRKHGVAGDARDNEPNERDGAPQVNHAPIDFQIDLVQMPDRMRFRDGACATPLQ